MMKKLSLWVAAMYFCVGGTCAEWGRRGRNSHCRSGREGCGPICESLWHSHFGAFLTRGASHGLFAFWTCRGAMPFGQRLARSGRIFFASWSVYGLCHGWHISQDCKIHQEKSLRHQDDKSKMAVLRVQHRHLFVCASTVNGLRPVSALCYTDITIFSFISPSGNNRRKEEGIGVENSISSPVTGW